MKLRLHCKQSVAAARMADAAHPMRRANFFSRLYFWWPVDILKHGAGVSESHVPPALVGCPQLAHPSFAGSFAKWHTRHTGPSFGWASMPPSLPQARNLCPRILPFRGGWVFTCPLAEQPQVCAHPAAAGGCVGCGGRCSRGGGAPALPQARLLPLLRWDHVRRDLVVPGQVCVPAIANADAGTAAGVLGDG
jgi:hypothetical protein